MNLIPIQSVDGSSEIFEEIKGKKFFAVSFDINGRCRIHQNKINNEEIVYACNLAIHSIMVGDFNGN